MNQFELIAVFIACVSAALVAGCSSGPNARGGGVIGGLTGAALGAAIGDRRGDPLAGAAIGAVAGAATGNAIGGGVDDQIEAQDNRIRAQQAAYQQQLARGAVSIPEVISMSRSGLNDEVILTQIHNHGIDRVLITDDLIYLKNNGVSDNVITAMQSTGPKRVVPAAYQQPVHNGPVIIERHVGPALIPAPVYLRHPRHHHHRGGPGWNVSVFHEF